MSTLKKVSTNLFRDKPTGTYYIVKRLNGKQIKESLNTTDKALASLRLHDRLATLPTATGRTDATWAEIEQLYLENYLPSKNLKPRSIKDRRSNLKTIRKLWVDLPTLKIRAIKPSDCEGWLARRLAQPHHSEQRINNELGALKQVFDLAVRDGIIARSPVVGLKCLKIQMVEIKLPEWDEFEKVVANLRLRRLNDAADMVEFLAYSGLRLGEALALTWEDIDWNRNRFLVTGGEQGTKNWDINSRPLFPRFKKLLEDIQERRAVTTGRILIHDRCYKALAGACKRVGCRRLTHHGLRHLFITSCLERGVLPNLIAKWVGHRDGGQLVMQRYGHVRNAAEDAAVKLLA